jgi:NADH-quinone oxidoreductase subunit N
MPTNAIPSANIYDLFYLSPAIVLTVWGLLVLLVDLGLARRLGSAERQRTLGRLALVGWALALVAAVVVCMLPIYASQNPDEAAKWFGNRGGTYLGDTDPRLFFGTLAGDPQVSYFNVVYILLLGLVLYLSTAWSFTEEWGEYFALMFWATVGMMLLTASEELITLFLTLETMTICLYLSTALEKTRRRSAEGGLKYFVYGSVSSALFLFGLSLLYGLTGTTQFESIRRLLVDSQESGLSRNVAGAMAVMLMMVGFGFKVAAVPFHQWAPDAYEGAPAPVTAWIATGSKLASFVALMKVFLHGLIPWASPSPSSAWWAPGWLGIIAIISAVTMTYGNFAALAQKNFKRMLAYSSIAHAGYILVGVAAASIATDGPEAAGSVLYYLIVYAFANVGAFAVAAWLVRDMQTDEIEDLNGLAYQYPALAACILILMLSLIGIPPLAGFFAKFYVFWEALYQRNPERPVTLLWLVALGLFNSVVSAFYYVRVLKAMYLREPGPRRLAPATTPIELPIMLGTLVVVVLGIVPSLMVGPMKAAAQTMLTGQLEVRLLESPAQPAGAQAPPSPAAPVNPREYEAKMKMGTSGGMGGGGGGAPPKGAQPKGTPAKGKASGKRKGAGAPKGAPAPNPAKSAASPAAKGDAARP